MSMGLCFTEWSVVNVPAVCMTAGGLYRGGWLGAAEDVLHRG